MFNSLFVFESTRQKQRNAPMLKQREEYLAHMRDQGVSDARLRRLAAMLLNVVRCVDIQGQRIIAIAELKEGSLRWLAETPPGGWRRSKKVSGGRFVLTAKNWLRFQNRLCTLPISSRPFEDSLAEFDRHLTVIRGFSRESARTCKSRMISFLGWASIKHDSLSTITFPDVDEFIAEKQDSGYRPRSVVSYCGALRLFFRYASSRGWNSNQIADNIRGPKIPRYAAEPKGPKWEDVRRLLSNRTFTQVELRATAIVCMCAIYGLRSSEVVNLKLSHFDWENETFFVTRVKRGRVQHFPIQFEVGEAILRYLLHGRPRCICRNLFVTIRPPYRAVPPATVWGIVADRMKRLGIHSDSYGGHSLRHACATELLRRGSPLKDIADFLGHKDLKSVCIYAKYDTLLLQKVADISLPGVK